MDKNNNIWYTYIVIYLIVIIIIICYFFRKCILTLFSIYYSNRKIDYIIFLDLAFNTPLPLSIIFLMQLFIIEFNVNIFITVKLLLNDKVQTNQHNYETA